MSPANVRSPVVARAALAAVSGPVTVRGRAEVRAKSPMVVKPAKVSIWLAPVRVAVAARPVRVGTWITAAAPCVIAAALSRSSTRTPDRSGGLVRVTGPPVGVPMTRVVAATARVPVVLPMVRPWPGVYSCSATVPAGARRLALAAKRASSSAMTMRPPVAAVTVPVTVSGTLSVRVTLPLVVSVPRMGMALPRWLKLRVVALPLSEAATMVPPGCATAPVLAKVSAPDKVTAPANVRSPAAVRPSVAAMTGPATVSGWASVSVSAPVVTKLPRVATRLAAVSAALVALPVRVAAVRMPPGWVMAPVLPRAKVVAVIGPDSVRSPLAVTATLPPTMGPATVSGPASVKVNAPVVV